MQVLVLRPRTHLRRVDLDLDLFRAQLAHRLPQRCLEVLGPDEAEVQLDRLGEQRVPAKEDGGRLEVSVDLHLGEAEDTGQELVLGLIDVQEEFGDFLELGGELVSNVGG